MRIGDVVVYNPGEFSRQNIGITASKIGEQGVIIAIRDWYRDDIRILYQLEFDDKHLWWVCNQCVDIGGPW